LNQRVTERFRTMGIFYLYQLQTAIDRYAAKNKGALPEPDDFNKILETYHDLLASGTWRQYYTESFMLDNLTAKFWRLPNLQDLPENCTEFDKQQDPAKPRRLSSLEVKLPRFAFRAVKTYLTNDISRVWVVERALSVLQQTTVRSRTESRRIEVYSETQAYFWVMYMHSILSKFEKSDLTGLQFVHLVAKGLVDVSAWRKHYSESRWVSLEARISFQQPDLQPLHFETKAISSELITDEVKKATQKRGLIAEIPSDEELVFALVIAMRQVHDVTMDELNFSLHSHVVLWLLCRLAVFEHRNIQPGSVEFENILMELRAKGRLSQDYVYALALAVCNARPDPLSEWPKRSEKIEERNEMFRHFLVEHRDLLLDRLEEEPDEKRDDVSRVNEKEEIAPVEQQEVDDEEMRQSILSELSKKTLDDFEAGDMTDSKTWEML
jgi:hypothetical protein